jgi:hypothetical protein
VAIVCCNVRARSDCRAGRKEPAAKRRKSGAAAIKLEPKLEPGAGADAVEQEGHHADATFVGGLFDAGAAGAPSTPEGCAVAVKQEVSDIDETRPAEFDVEPEADVGQTLGVSWCVGLWTMVPSVLRDLLSKLAQRAQEWFSNCAWIGSGLAPKLDPNPQRVSYFGVACDTNWKVMLRPIIDRADFGTHSEFRSSLEISLCSIVNTNFSFVRCPTRQETSTVGLPGIAQGSWCINGGGGKHGQSGVANSWQWCSVLRR